MSKLWFGLVSVFGVVFGHAFAAADGAGKFTFDGWAGPAIPVYYFEPDGVLPGAPVIMVMHGNLRNADDYRDSWKDIATANGWRIYAPEFARPTFATADEYNLGNMSGTDGWQTFDAVEALFTEVQRERGVAADSYILFGHSAGAQFVHRAVLLRRVPRASMTIAANAGWYTMPTTAEAWPYGLGGVDAAAFDIGAALSATLVILLGDQDIDPNDSALRQTPEAARQGPNRLVRGRTFYAVGSLAAQKAGLAFGWTLSIVPDVSHDHAGMAAGAAPLIAAHLRATDAR